MLIDPAKNKYDLKLITLRYVRRNAILEDKKTVFNRFPKFFIAFSE